jgi:D-sedoheptulose 7-phosphate isomerase
VSEEFVEQIVVDLELSRAVFDRALDSPSLLTSVAEASRVVLAALRAGNKLLIAGNGGSAADAQHIAAEFVSRFNFDRAPLAAVALTTDSSILTAIGNDYGFERLFSRQIGALGQRGDVFIGITTSGASPNILAGIRAAREAGLHTIALTGSRDAPVLGLADLAIQVPSDRTPLIQQLHITIGHIICSIVEVEMFGQASA